MAAGAYLRPAPSIVDESEIPSGLDIFGTIDGFAGPTIKMWKMQALSPRTSPLVKAALEIILDGLEPIGNAIKEGIVNYLEETYKDMWDVSSYYTGNLRGSLDLVGDIKNNPYAADIEVDMEQFLAPKTMVNLREKKVTTTYELKSGKKVTREYRYAPYTKTVKVGGTNYIPYQDAWNVTSRPGVGKPRLGGPFVVNVWEMIIKEQNRRRYK